MFRILGEGEAATLADPHRLPPPKAPPHPALTQRSTQLEPLPERSRAASADSPRGGSIAAYHPSHALPFPQQQRQPGAEPQSVQLPAAASAADQLAALAHEGAGGSDTLARLWQHCLQTGREAAASTAQLQGITDTVHGLQHAAATLQVREARETPRSAWWRSVLQAPRCACTRKPTHVSCDKVCSTLVISNVRTRLYLVQASAAQERRDVAALQQTMQAQHSTLLAEVAARDARIQHLSQEGSHAQQALQGAMQQMQALVASHKHDSEQVCRTERACNPRALATRVLGNGRSIRRASERGCPTWLQVRSELTGEIQRLKDRLGAEESTVLRLQHAEELAHSAVQGEMTQLRGSVAGQVARLQGSVQQAQAAVLELSQQLQAERQQRAADATAFQGRLAHAQQQAEEQITCGLCHPVLCASKCSSTRELRATCACESGVQACAAGGSGAGGGARAGAGAHAGARAARPRARRRAQPPRGAARRPVPRLRARARRRCIVLAVCMRAHARQAPPPPCCACMQRRGARRLQANDKEAYLQRFVAVEATLKEAIAAQLAAERALDGKIAAHTEQMHEGLRRMNGHVDGREAALREQLEAALRKLRSYARDVEHDLEAARCLSLCRALWLFWVWRRAQRAHMVTTHGVPCCRRARSWARSCAPRSRRAWTPWRS